MTTVSLMYHDVTPAGREDTSGFPGGDAARYKLTPQQFDAHLDAIARALDACAARTSPAQEHHPSALLTFDDGGVSAAECIADRLERRGWHGHFFVTGAYIDTPRFLNRRQIRDLAARGHTIGSHSQTHPLRMGRCSVDRLQREWTVSLQRLADVLGSPVTTASVPGGHYSPAVADSAMGAGVRTLFTSQPTITQRVHGEGLVIGRFAIQRSTPPATVAALVEGVRLARWRRQATWALKSVAKEIGGDRYLQFRDRVLGGGKVRWGDTPAGVSEDPS